MREWMLRDVMVGQEEDFLEAPCDDHMKLKYHSVGSLLKQPSKGLDVVEHQLPRRCWIIN